MPRTTLTITIDSDGQIHIGTAPITCPTTAEPTPCPSADPVCQQQTTQEPNPIHWDTVLDADDPHEPTTTEEPMTDETTETTETTDDQDGTTPDTPDTDTITLPTIDPNLKFRRGVIPAMRVYTASHPWQGSRSERTAKLQAFHGNLCAVYGRRNVTLEVLTGPGASTIVRIPDSGGATIRLNRRMSVLTYLHLFRQATAKPRHTPEQIRTWGVTLFAKFYPYRASVLLERTDDAGRMTLPTRHVGRTAS